MTEGARRYLNRYSNTIERESEPPSAFGISPRLAGGEGIVASPPSQRWERSKRKRADVVSALSRGTAVLSQAHDHIVKELSDSSRSDAIFLLTAIVFNLVVLAINASVSIAATEETPPPHTTSSWPSSSS